MKEENVSVEVILVERNNIKVESKRRTEENVVSPSPKNPPSDPPLQIVVQETEETRERATGPFLQFYRKNLKESSRRSCMNKWAFIVEQHVVFVLWTFVFYFKLSGCVGITIFKIILGILVIIFFYFEYNKNIRHITISYYLLSFPLSLI